MVGKDIKRKEMTENDFWAKKKRKLFDLYFLSQDVETIFIQTTALYNKTFYNRNNPAKP